MEGVLALWSIDTLLHIVRNRGHHELIEGLEAKLLVVLIELEESVPVEGILDHLSRRHSTELDYLKHLIVVIFSWEDWYIDE